MKEKIEEYITELDNEIDRCVFWLKDHIYVYGETCSMSAMEGRICALMEVKNDLQSRLDEL